MSNTPVTLSLSGNRKVSPLVAVGTQERPKVMNASGLPAGPLADGGSCPGATTTCERVCYAAAITAQWKGPRDLCQRNLDALLAAATVPAMTELLVDVIGMFVSQVDKLISKGVGSWEQLAIFRWHWNGDVFSATYAEAMAAAMARFPDVTFWCYTRSFDFVPILARVPNLSLYLSVDVDNIDAAESVLVDFPWVGVATLGETWSESEEMQRHLTGRNAPRCPELTGKTSLVVGHDGRTTVAQGDTGQGACSACRLCVNGTNNVRFAINN